MKSSLAFGLFAAAAISVCLVPAEAHASSIPAFTITGSDPIDGGDWRTQGWRFGVSSTITVTDLGVFDANSDGLGESHNVGLWSCNDPGCTTGTLLTSLTVPGGTGPSLDNFFRYSVLGSSVVLTAGDYVIGAAYGANQDNGVQLDTVISWSPSGAAHGFTLAPQLSFEGDRVSNVNPHCAGVCTPDAGFPTDVTSFGQPSFFGPSFKFTEGVSVAAVPEPGTLLLLGSGLAGVLAARHRRNRNR